MFDSMLETGTRHRAGRAAVEAAEREAGGIAGWSAFFPAGTAVIALPDWFRPRLIVPASTVQQRWSGSGFYPAFRFDARAYRWLLRLRAAGRLAVERKTPELGAGPSLRECVADVIPGATVRALMVGMANRAQKLTAQLVTADGRIIGYLKCAGSDLGRERLRNEYDLLRLLTPGAGPQPLKYCVFAGMDALLTRPVEGRLLPAVLPPPKELLVYAGSLHTSVHHPVERHPWFSRPDLVLPPRLRAITAVLAEREWPVVRQHGDLAPWNAVRGPTGTLTMVDWEYGAAEGFPGLDLAHYVLQVAALVYRWKPERARTYAAGYLTSRRDGPSPVEASAIVSLAAFQAFTNTLMDGHGMDDPLQVWRRAIWSGGQA